jgi:FkbM family methyltransferase
MPLLQNGLCRVIGFEPQADALAALNAKKSELETYLPYAVGNGVEGTLRICRASGMTSLFAPNPVALRHFNSFSEWGEVLREVPISTRRLDDISEVDVVDFLKIDVQGSELSVFQNGRNKLGRAVAIQTEVSFIQLYAGQPVFGDIDLELRTLGFVPHSFVAIKKRLIAPLINPADPHGGINQLLEADIVYVRDFLRSDQMQVEQLKHLALNCLHHLTTRGTIAADAQSRYLGLIQGGQ